MIAGKSVVVLAILLLGGSSALSTAARAQTLQGELLDRTRGGPVEGALILLLNPDQEAEGGSLTDEEGRFLIRAPGPGRYSLKAFRIGYETTVSEPFDLAQGGTLEVRLETEMSPIVLSELRVEAEPRCVVRPGENLELARAWEEARKALTVQRWTEGEDLFRFRATRVRREMDAGGVLVLSETRQVMGGLSSNPVRSRPGEELIGQGFVRVVEGNRYDYYGTDASVLLSDPFLDTHCFRFRLSPEKPDLMGLAFEPVREVRPPDIQGVLWLNRISGRLGFLEFTYDWAPGEAAEGVAKGRVEFLELPNGAWVIPRWWIRMPTLRIEMPGPEGGRATTRLIGTLEVGWDVETISTLDQQVITPRATGRVRGWVRERGSARPLAGARVILTGIPHGASTESDGRFQVDGVPEGWYAVSFTTPLLDSLGVRPRGQDIRVRGEETAEVSFEAPSRTRILESVCGSLPGGPGSALLTGTVWAMGSGEPVAGAEVTVEWGEERRLFWDSPPEHIQVSANSGGRYRVCGVPEGVPVRVWATSEESTSPVTSLEARPGDIVLRDLWTAGN